MDKFAITKTGLYIFIYIYYNSNNLVPNVLEGFTRYLGYLSMNRYRLNLISSLSGAINDSRFTTYLNP